MERRPEKAFEKEPRRGEGVFQKVFLIFRRVNVTTSNPKQPDEYLVDIKITRAAAEKVCGMNPGSYIVRGFATK